MAFSMLPGPGSAIPVTFSVNMSKAVDRQLFEPGSDQVYVEPDHGILPLMMVQGPGYVYTLTVFNLLDSGVTYHYHYNINLTTPESVDRTVTIPPNTDTLSSWWNDDPANRTTFVVNMTYAVANGLFNPDADSVCIAGTMNGNEPSPAMVRASPSFDYSIVYGLAPATVQQYKYLINGDTARSELKNKPPRIVRIADSLMTCTSDFDNYDPEKRPMTFACDMGYYVRANHFDPSSDYLDVAGNFTGSRGDALFDTDGDTIYTLEKQLDTTWFSQGPLAFRFRINGDSSTAELPGKPDRTYAFHDTAGQDPNLYACHYNNLDPAVPTPPWAYGLGIQGLLIYKKVLSGIYSYENVNGIPEGNSTYRWLRSSDALGSDTVAIDSATQITYTVDTLDISKWLVFEVTPIAAEGDSAMGKPMRFISSSNISAWDVGIKEYSGLIARLYPNPASDHISVEAKTKIDRIELFNYLNQPVLIKGEIGLKSDVLSIGHLPRGLYIVKATTKSGQTGVARVIKY